MPSSFPPEAALEPRFKSRDPARECVFLEGLFALPELSPDKRLLRVWVAADKRLGCKTDAPRPGVAHAGTCFNTSSSSVC